VVESVFTGTILTQWRQVEFPTGVYNDPSQGFTAIRIR
jgi:hypothetical protein